MRPTETSPATGDGAPEMLTRRFPARAGIPNNPLLPVVLYRGALPQLPAATICALMRENGWSGTWVWSVFDYHHYHPDAHEALICASGHARIRLGGPKGETFDIGPGDALVLPAGTGHCRLSETPDFRICGAYPPGQTDFTTRRAGQQDDRAKIAAVPLPETDPLFGREGPLLDLWRQAARG